MPRSRSVGQFGRALTFGGRVPPAVGLLIALVVVASLAGALVPGLAGAAVFVPGLVLQGQLWRLVTWAFVETQPLSLVFAGLILWWLGRDLALAWGEGRFLVICLGLAVASALVTLFALAALRLPLMLGFLGTWAVLSGLTVAWGLSFADRQILFYMVLPLSGRALVWITVGGTLLYALFEHSLLPFLPHLVAQGLAALYVRGRRAGRRFSGFRWNPLGRLRRDRKRFKVVEVDQDPDRDRPRWLN
jgi:membrane associated rhomboid family serine protease